jgi:amino acid adenylation domain-containing protein/non-ribosomal peptide synthase protein (TIGR01720 family)
MQVTARANQVGIIITPKQLFNQQTIAELALVAGNEAQDILSEQGLVSGEVILTPIQQLFFEQTAIDAHYDNQAVLLGIPSELEPVFLEKIAQELLLQHDTLRSSFMQIAPGKWQQMQSDKLPNNLFIQKNISNISILEQPDKITGIADQIQASLSLADGQIIRFVLIELGHNQPNRLLIVIHHLVVDGVSWRIILEDLQTIYQQLAQHQPVQLPRKTTSFQQWAVKLQEYAQSTSLVNEQSYWLKADYATPRLPVDFTGCNDIQSSQDITVYLTPAETQALLKQVPQVYNTQVNDLLLTALAQVLSKWLGSDTVSLDLEGHGREELFVDVDISRTVGWFTTVFPVVLELSGASNIGDAIKTVKEQLRQIPQKGIGYGLLRYLHQDEQLTVGLQTLPQPEILFNYLGQFDQTLNSNSQIRMAPESSGSNQSSQAQRSHLIEIDGAVNDGQLQISWTYSQNIHQAATIEHLANEYINTLRGSIQHCLLPDVGGHTPSDFPLANISQLQLDSLEMSQTNLGSKNIADIYPLSPMQQGMLFHSLYAPESGVYMEITCCQFSENLNTTAFEQAWQRLVARHDILRTAFVWQELAQPLQVVYHQVPVSIQVEDWQHFDLSQVPDTLTDFLVSQQQQGFQLSKAPLQRLYLIRLANQKYEFVWVIHHLLVDGWSSPLIFQELLNNYEALSAGESWMPEPAAPYRNYIGWLLQQDRAAAEIFWREKLQGFTNPTSLQYLQKTEVLDNVTGYRELELSLSMVTTQAMKTFVKQHQLTVNNLVQGAWALLLSRYSGVSDIVFGATVSGRPPTLIGVDSMIGLFINTLPLRVVISSTEQVVPWLQQIMSQQVECDGFSYASLADIQSWSDLPNGIGLFDSIVVFENYPMRQVADEYDHLLQADNFQGVEQTNYPLALSASLSDQLLLKISYDAKLFAANTIQRLLQHLQILLTGLIANPEQRIVELPILTTAEQQQLLVDWNDTQADYPHEQCIHQLFEAQVHKMPEAIAVVCGTEQLTYQELDIRANQLAHHLQNLGVKTNMFIGLCVERSLEMILGMLAILKAGGAYVPLDPNYPLDRLNFMISDSQVPILLTQKHLVSILGEQQATVICLDADWPQSHESPQDIAQSTDLAYMIYTSGSTGTPKGVMLPHKGLCNLVQAQTKLFNIQATSRVLQFASFSFDASTWEIFMALGNGATLYIDSKEALLGEALLNYLQAQKITHVTLPPAVLAVLPITPLTQLKTMIVAGEACSPELIRQWSVDRSFFNAYGPTEGTVCATISTPLDGSMQPIPIGKPIQNVQVYILDNHLQPLPIGIPGELHIGGVGVAHGYFNRPELTTEKFIPNPYSDDPDARLYKTGDLARYLPDGNIEYLGRIDDQVKIRGFRVELGEVEAAISQYPHVLQVTVVDREDKPSNKQIVAYIVPQSGQEISSNEIRIFLKGKLPDYMVPAMVVCLNELPLTPNGKIDRRALPVPNFTQLHAEEYVVPRNKIEKSLSEIWSEVLGIPQIGIHDNFFTLGGDSIISIQVTARANQAGMVITPKQLFDKPTIAELALVVRNEAQEIIFAEQGLVSGKGILTPIQRLFFEQIVTDTHYCNQSFLLTIPAELGSNLLAQVAQELLLHHDVLRSRFMQTAPGQWQQIQGDELPINLFAQQDLSDISILEQPGKLTEIAEQTQASLSLADGQIIRFVLMKLGGEQPNRLLIIIHHLVVDGVSWRIILDDLQTIYQQLAQHQPVRLPRKTTSFQQWAVKLQEYAQSTSLAAEQSYWLGAKYTTPRLPVDFTGCNDVQSGREITVSLTAAETQALLQQTPRAYNTQINDLLLTALAQVLGKWLGSDAVSLDLEGHGREELFADVDTSRTVGWFTTLFPVVLDLCGISGIGDAVKTVKEQLRQIPQKGIGYGLLRYLHQDVQLSNEFQCLCQPEILFNYLGQFDQTFSSDSQIKMAQESSGSDQSSQAQRPHLIDVNGIISNGQLQISWAYSQNIHELDTIERLANEYINTLRELIDHCSLPNIGGHTPSDFPLAHIPQLQLDLLVTNQSALNFKNIVDIYPLSPMQQGMLFHSLYAPESGVYIEITSCQFSADLNIAAFEKAWQMLVDRHEILRTAFVWEELKQPLQVVYHQVPVAIEVTDWQHLELSQVPDALMDFLSSQQQQGFRLTQAPLQRLYLMRLANHKYQFVWVIHHLLVDGWSSPLIFQELLNNYEAFSSGKSWVPQPAAPYRNYISWLSQQDHAAAEAFWRERLEGFDTPTSLQHLQKIGVLDGAAGYKELELSISVVATQAVEKFAKQHQLTVNNVVQGAWALLLSRYSGESDIVFGATVSGRPATLSGVDSMIGLFINTLPVRVAVSGAEQVVPWLQQIMSQQIESDSFSYTSLIDIQSWSDLPGGIDLFDSIVVFENYPMRQVGDQHDGLLQIDNFQAVEQTNYPLTLCVSLSEQLLLQISYNAGLFAADTIQRLLQNFQTLLIGLIANPEQQVSELPVLAAAERQQLLIDWNDTLNDYSQKHCVHQLFEQQVEKTPQAIAIVCGAEQLTYQELNYRANQLAHYLKTLGVQSNTLVGLCIERSLEMVIGILGIFKAGGAYVPLDPNYPSERLSFMLTTAQVTILLTQASLIDQLPVCNASLLCLDRDWPKIVRSSSANLKTVTTLDQLGYVIYTSGSTGQPKGVAMPQRALVNLIQWQMQQSSDSHKTLQFAPISFDVSFQEIFATVCAGSTLVLIEEDLRQDFISLLNLLEEQNIDRLFLPFVALQQLAETAASRSSYPVNLRTVITAGEQLKITPAIRQFFRHLPSCHLHNHYGPSESHVVTSLTLSDSVDDWPNLPAIGRPIFNTQIHILDQQLQPSPIGAIGELYIGGDCLAQGYWQREDLTKDKFISNPFSSKTSAKLYKTGDLARYLPDGNIEYLGRIDQQVKIRGFRIELGEVEAAINKHLQVSQVTVIDREDKSGNKQLVAYAVLQSGVEISGNEIRGFLKGKLPDYMLPAIVVCLDKLPLTPSGKIDRKALPKPNSSDAIMSEFIAPRTQTEEVLANIWIKILDLEKVGIYDNFFDIGGHSLLATQVVSRINEAFQVKLPLQSLFEEGTLVNLADKIDRICWTLQEFENHSIDSANEEEGVL